MRMSRRSKLKAMTVSDRQPWRAGSAKARAVEDRPVDREIREFRPRRAAQQVADEERVPRKLGHDPDPEAVRRISARVEILHEPLSPPHVGAHGGLEPVEGLGRHGPVVVPPDGRFGGGAAHDVLVLGRASGMRPGRRDHRAALGQPDLAPRERHFHKRRLGLVAIERAEPAKTRFFKR